MRFYFVFISLFSSFIFAQNIKSIQLFNPKTNDETPIIQFGEKLILRFDDLDNARQNYRYTIKHFDRNWKDDGLFYTEYATGNLNASIDKYTTSFNTYQQYTNYVLEFPNEKIQPKISGNFELIVYKDSPQKPLFKRRFCVIESGASIGLNISRYSNARKPDLNQRVQAKVISNNVDLNQHLRSLGLKIIQNNNWNTAIPEQKPSIVTGKELLFQQLDLVFSGNNEFFYFDNKVIDIPFDAVASTENKDGYNHTYLFSNWVFPTSYQYNPDVNGAFYFRRNDKGIERDSNKEADYSWVYFSFESPWLDREIYVLGMFNDYTPSEESKMIYNEESKRYVAKIYLKQGFYNYAYATKLSNGEVRFNEINGNFWQTENLYQALLYYTPLNRNYDGLMGYGEIRKTP